MASKEPSLTEGLNTIAKEQRNPQRIMTYEDGAFDTYKKYKVLMFKEQMKIYQNIARLLCSQDIVLEAGCGIGLGTAILERNAQGRVMGSDKCQDNVDIAKQLYPWITFCTWDIRTPLAKHRGRTPVPNIVIAVEVIEHIEYPTDGIFRLIDAAKDVVYISTPNGNGKPRPPSNPYHVCEYTVQEMLETITDHIDVREVDILHPETFQPFSHTNHTTTVSPLVYRIRKGGL